MVPGFLGYTVLLLTGLVVAWGVAVFRHIDPRRLLYATGLAGVGSFVLATLIGWFGMTLETDLTTWAGAVGMGTAGWMQRILGVTGSLIVLIMTALVMVLLVVDYDIQRSIDRIVDFVRTSRERLRTWYVDWSERRARRKAEQESQRTEREKQRAKERKKREQEIEEERRKQEEKRRRAAEHKEAQKREAERQEQLRRKQSHQKQSRQKQSEQQNLAEERPSREGQPPTQGAEVTPHVSPSPTDETENDLRKTNSETSAESENDAPSPSPGEKSSGSSTDPSSFVPSGNDGSSGAGMTIRNDLFRDRLHKTTFRRDRTDSEDTDDPDAGPVPDPLSADGLAETHKEPAETDSASDADMDLGELEPDFSEAFDRVGDPDDESDESEELDDTPSDAARSESATQTDGLVDASSDMEDDSEDAQPADVEMEVQEQVEEEKADSIDRAASVPEEVPYQSPSIDLLDASQESDRSVDRDELEENKRVLLDKLETYNIEIQDIRAVVGPTVTRYELTPAPGIKVSRIKSLEDDLAMAMAAQGIRMIAPIPGKSAVGVEIPNRNRELVRLREVIGTAKFRDTEMELPFPLGKSIEGEVFLADLTKMPHLLIAGATGSGKSVGLNTLLTGLIYACHPSNLKFVIIDPKKIELQQYAHLEQHFIARPADLDDAVVTDVDEALGVLKSCEKEMEERYDLLSEASVRGIRAYNRKFQNGDLDPADGHRHMPYIVVVVDELADLMMTAGKEIEGPIARLAQMARAVGIHLVLATQRPSVDVITGLIKANFPSRIAYEVASRVDSRTILDQMGAEGLVGNGDLLYLSGSKLIRLQGPFVSVEEVERIVDFVADQPPQGSYELPSLSDAGHGPDVTLGVEDTDELFEDGARVIVRRQQGSVSLLQRKLAVGYTRAARIVDQLEEAGIVGPFNGTKARDVLVEDEQQLDELLSGEDEDE
jgi:S-DNA-T family DNA segregation ATPase FtsK/SpoIIIE